MQEALQNSWFMVLMIVLGAVGLIAALLLSRRSPVGRKPRSLLDYVLEWPLLFDKERERDPQRGDRLFTKRELIRWGIVISLIILAIAFTGRD